MNLTQHTKEEITNLISEIPDPEIPVITIADLGILREVQWDGTNCKITITPTYTGCPAMKMIEDDIKAKLKNIGINNVTVELVYSPVWTTDWINDNAKEKLRIYGIAPPHHTSVDKKILLGKERSVECPHCGSSTTVMVSQFGSTACKALYRCDSCKEPFDYFKCL